MTTRIAYVVSAHGFGHAARSAAVMNALRERLPDVVQQIFTTVPEWFFEDSLSGAFEYHEAVTDVGMVQLSPVEEDPAATLRALNRIRPLTVHASVLAESLRRLDCRLVVCDVSPLGLAAAKLAGIPSVLVESFTWDWIYESYFDAEPGLREAAAEMAEIFDGADLRIQTEPVCRPAPGAFTVPPVYRRSRSDAGSVRRRLGLDDDRPMVLITMGGSAWSLDSRDQGAGAIRPTPAVAVDAPVDRRSASGTRSRRARPLHRTQETRRLHSALTGATRMSFVVFGGTAELERRGNVLLLPERSPVFVPDLIVAADLVVGKLGYSTAAEAWAAGTRYAYVPRPAFPEGASLGAFVRAHLPSFELEPAALSGAEWLDQASGLLGEPRAPRQTENGADRIAKRLDRMLS